MKGVKGFAAAVTVVGMLAAAGAAYASVAKTPADIVSDVTGKTIEEITKERTSGKTYGTIAEEAGKLDVFKAQMLDQKKALLDQQVKDGTLTQQKADEIYDAIKNNQATCNGTGANGAGIGKKYGVGFGRGSGSSFDKGQGAGQHNGSGAGMHMGGGMGEGSGLNR